MMISTEGQEAQSPAQRYALIPLLEEEINVAGSGGDRVICPIVISAVELVVLAGIWTSPTDPGQV